MIRRRFFGSLGAILLLSVLAVTGRYAVLSQESYTLHTPMIIAFGNVGGSSLHTDGDNARDPGNHPIQIRPADGSGLQYIHAPNAWGDLTHGGSPRYIVDLDPMANPEMGIHDVLVVKNEKWIEPGLPHPPNAWALENGYYWAVLLDDAAYNLNSGGWSLAARWSLDGNRIIFGAIHTYTLNGQPVVEDGLFVGKIVRDAYGRPAGLWDEITTDLDNNPVPNTARFVLPGVRDLDVSWSPDHHTVTYAFGNDVFVFDVDQPCSPGSNPLNLTQTPNTTEAGPAFSPVADSNGNYPMVYGQYMYAVKGSPFGSADRWDLFVRVYSPTTRQWAGPAVPLTTKSKCAANGIGQPSWSPDGKEIAFRAGDRGSPGIWRIRADGTAKAVKLTDPKQQTMGGPRWRR